jgi:ABC-type spermidine/putrescine transport system permease subunit I
VVLVRHYITEAALPADRVAEMHEDTTSLHRAVVYSALRIVRNTIVGLEGVDSAMRDAARAAGMRPMKSLLRVELPLTLLVNSPASARPPCG